MSDLGDVTARLAELSDADFAAAVHRTTANRPALAPLYAAADGIVHATMLPAAEESGVVPAQPSVPTAGEVPAPVAFSVSDSFDLGYTDNGVPTLGGVRDKIERRLGSAEGTGAPASPAARSVERQWSHREKAGQDKLEEIRQSLRKTLKPER